MEGRQIAVDHGIHNHVGGVSAQFGVVHAAGGKGAVAHEGVCAGVVGHTRLDQALGDGQLGVHHPVVGGGEDGVHLIQHVVGGGHDLIGGVAGAFHVLHALGIQICLGVLNGLLAVVLGQAVQQADGLNVRVLGKHHVQDEIGVQGIGGTGHVLGGQAGGLRVRNSGIHHGDVGALGGVLHALGGQRGNGHHRIVAVAHHLRADLVQRGGIVLAVELGVLNGHAQLGGLCVQLGLGSLADLVQAGVVQLLHNGHPVGFALGRAGGRLAGSSGGGRSGRAAGGQRQAHHSGERSGDHLVHLFHGNILTIQFVLLFAVCPGRGGGHGFKPAIAIGEGNGHKRCGRIAAS